MDAEPSMAQFLKIFLCVALISFGSCYKYPRDACIKGDTPDIPPDHLFYKKTQPLVLGHRGQSKKYQENTIEGIQSLIDLGADGFETDVYLTDYGQLVLFHADNAKKLTGVDRAITKMNSTEIANLKYKKTLVYGMQTYNFEKERSVGLLEDLFKKIKDTNLLIHLEMKPMSWEAKKSEATGRAVAQLIKKYNLQKKVLLTSMDALKLKAAKLENPDVAVGSYVLKRYYTGSQSYYAGVKNTMKRLHGLKVCLDALPNNRSLQDFLFETGSAYKSINGSFVEFELGLFHDKALIKEPVKTLRDNYNKNITFGASTIYSMSLDETEIKKFDSTVEILLNQKVARLITDDVPRLMTRLGRKRPIKPSSGNPHLTTHAFGSFVIFFVSCIFCLFNYFSI